MSVLLRDYSKKDAIWDKHKNDAVKIAELLANDDEFNRYVVRLNATAQEIAFKWVDNKDTHETELKLKNAWFSRWRHDPVSNWRKTLKWRALWFGALPDIFAAYPTHRWVFVTLTVQNCKIDDLGATCRHLNQSFRRLVRTGKLKQYFYLRKGETSNAGYYRALEVTKEKERDGYAHPHLHVLFHFPAGYFDKSNYITQQTWAESWQKSARLDYLPIVDVRIVKPKKTAQNAITGEFEQSKLIDAVLEVTKYPMKAADLLIDADWTKEYIRQMHNIRLNDLGGTLKAFIHEERLDDDLINIDDETLAQNDDENNHVSHLLFFTFDAQKSVRKYVKNDRF